MRLGDRLQTAREYLGFDRDQAGAFSGLGAVRIAELEAGDFADELELQRLARAYGCRLSYFDLNGPTTVRVSGSARLFGDLTDHDHAELELFVAFLRESLES